ncbi:hypothetical protein [Lacticaseibacillus manihotivorans]|nr:hypothetical protein [Lacticaseibacillus manihotivorans]
MRLKQLHMQNFGPYRDEQVDFEAFDTTPLFFDQWQNRCRENHDF